MKGLYKRKEYIDLIHLKEKKNKGKHLMKGSLTVEAAMVLPVFIIALLCILNFFVIINYQNIMQYSLHYAAQSVGRYSYIMNHADSLLFNSSTKGVDTHSNKRVDQNIQENVNQNIDGDVIHSGISLGYVWKKLLTDELKAYTKKSNVLNGVNGISILGSEINKEENKGISDIKVSYAIKSDLFGKKEIVQLANRCYFRAWVGESIIGRGADTQQGQTVYITKTGRVYHYSSTCSYIKILATGVRYAEVSGMRNANGGKYKACTACVKGQLNDNNTVYVTTDGKRYHSNNQCSKIKREVTAIDISEVGSRRACSKCGGNK